MEDLRSELLGSCPRVGYRSAYGAAVGAARTPALGVCTLAGAPPAIDGPQAPQESAAARGGRRGRAWRQERGYCREKLAAIARQAGITASASTIHRYLQREGLVRPPLRYRRPRFQNGQAMRPANCPGLGYLQMDVKHIEPRLSGLPYTCYEYAAIDIRSRYKVALLLPSLDETGSLLALYHVTQSYPFPLR
jgi:hypothetical protein